MKAALLLADWADAINGKLYIQGGGWSITNRGPAGTINFAIACKLYVGWTEANRKHRIVFVIRDDDGKVFEPTEGDPFRIESTLEVGRPAGIKEGSDIDSPLAFNIAGMPIPGGRYRLDLEVNDELKESVVFDVLG